MKKLVLLMLPIFLFTGCGKSNGSDKKGSTVVTANQVQKSYIPLGEVNSDSAYQFVADQVAFGPRVPGSEAHRQCGDYLVEKLTQYGATVEEQIGEARLYNGRPMAIRNIIGRYNPEAKRRILLSAHWDTRPFADRESDSSHWNTPIDGANDGASGVGVLIELARLLQNADLPIGVDIVFFDLEDWGTPEFHIGPSSEHSYCLGSQYWAEEIKNRANKPEAGILLDMVGAPGAKFFQEQVSSYYAPQLVKAIWQEAANLGFSSYFIPTRGGAITDDHLYVNQIAGIPCIDIIQYDPNSETGFGEYWHTRNDNMKQIDRTTLYVVGATVARFLNQYQ